MENNNKHNSNFTQSDMQEGNNIPYMYDYGPYPLVVNIDKYTKFNENFRTALWTGKHMQLTLMDIPVMGEIGVEMHSDTDQFLRIEDGYGLVKIGSNKNNLNYQRRVGSDFAIIIPAGTWHNIINIGNTPLKIYSLYAPPQHPFGTIHKTKESAQHND